MGWGLCAGWSSQRIGGSVARMDHESQPIMRVTQTSAKEDCSAIFSKRAWRLGMDSLSYGVILAFLLDNTSSRIVSYRVAFVAAHYGESGILTLIAGKYLVGTEHVLVDCAARSED